MKIGLMRTIKFKAKHKESQNWVYGKLNFKTGKIEWEEEHDGYITLPWHSQIDENTICQSTGITDVNGNEIYENDIVETFSIYMSYQQVGNYPPPNIEVEEWDVKRSVNIVEFNYASFNINDFPMMFEDRYIEDEEYDDSEEKHQFECLWEDNTFDIQDRFPYLTWDYFKKPHIIGNKFDNTEILEN